jgi:hypothetical protein
MIHYEDAKSDTKIFFNPSLPYIETLAPPSSAAISEGILRRGRRKEQG